MAEHHGSRAGLDRLPFEIDTGVAHPARIHNYLAGGDDHFAADREAVDHMSTVLPGGLDDARATVRALRGFMVRALLYLVDEAGIRQFIKIGTTIPTAKDVHEIVQDSAPTSRVIYVGCDPVVLAHSHALHRSRPEGAATYVHGTLCDPKEILQQAAGTLDLSQPIAVIVLSTLNFVPDDRNPYGLMAGLLDGLVPGSYLALAHTTSDLRKDMNEVAERFSEMLREPFVVRSHTEIVRFFDDLKLVEPGLVQIDQWPDRQRILGSQAVAPIYGAVGLKPLPSPSPPAAHLDEALNSADARVRHPAGVLKEQEDGAASPYQTGISVWTKVDLADHLAIVWFMLGKIGFQTESVAIRTSRRPIEDISLSGALAAVHATEEIKTVHVDLRGHDRDELTSTLMWRRDVRPFTEITIRGADQAHVASVAGEVRSFIERTVPESSVSVFETGAMVIHPRPDESRNKSAPGGSLSLVDKESQRSWWGGVGAWLGAKRDDLLVQFIAGLLVATVSALVLMVLR